MRQNERDATVIWLWNKLESNMSPLTPKVHSQGSLSKFTLKVLGNTEGSKLSDSVDILSRFTLKVHSQGSLSRFLAILKVPSFQTQLTCTHMMLLIS